MQRAEKELLAFWQDTLPLEVVGLYPGLLPKGTELPSKPLKEPELLSLYKRLVPEPIVQMLGRLVNLEFPILDVRHLAEELTGSSKEFNATARQIVLAVHSSDFPLRGFRPTADIVSVRTASYMFASCHRALQECRRKRDPNFQLPSATELAKCDQEFQECSDKVSMQMFVALTADWWRPAVPPHWRPWWPGPQPSPEPPYLR